MAGKTESKTHSTICQNIVDNYQSIIPEKIKSELNPKLGDIYNSLDANTPTTKIYSAIDCLWESIIEFATKHKIIDSLPHGILLKLKYELIMELTSSLGPAITTTKTSIESFLNKHDDINGVFHYKGVASSALKEWDPHGFTQQMILNRYKQVYETRFVDDLFSANTPLQEYIHSHIKRNLNETEKNSYSFSQCNTHLTNTLLYSFSKKPNFSKNYFRYSLLWILELRENLRLLLCKKIPIYEKLLISYYSEQLLSLSYLRSGYNFIFGEGKPEISVDNLNVVQGFTYVYFLTHMISSNVLKNYYLCRFCKNNKIYFPISNKLGTRFSIPFTASLLKVEFGVLPYLKNMFYYHLYQLSQNKKLTLLHPPKAYNSYSDDNCLYRLCCNYLNSQCLFLDNAILNKEGYIKKKDIEKKVTAPEGRLAIYLYLSKIYLLDNQLSKYIEVAPDKSNGYLELLYNSSKTLPSMSCLELFEPLLTPIHDSLFNEIFSPTFPFTQYYTEFLFQKNYGYSDFTNFCLNIT